MNSKVLETCVNKISELVVDEGKIVTYKSLGLILGIHVNTAKQLLQSYMSKQRLENLFSLSATYLLAGELINGEFSIAVATDETLNDSRSKFLNITSEHIYSIQKGKTVNNINNLSNICKEPQNVESIIIKCSKSVIKSKVHNENKRVPQVLEEKKKSLTFFQESKCSVNVLKSNAQREKDENKKAQVLIEEKKKSPGTGKSPKKTNSKAVADSVNTEKRNIGNFFSNMAQKSKPENSSSKKEEVVIVDKGVENKQDKKKIDSEELSKRKKKGNKRKRIHIYSESEESESDNEVSAECKYDEPPPKADLEDDPEDLNRPISINDPVNKRKKRKIVDKTIMNEDGYLETRKEIVFETDSECEAEAYEKSPLPNEAKISKPVTDKEKASARCGKKQSSLFNFFKKN